MPPNSRMPATMCRYCWRGSRKLHSMFRQTALIPSAHTCGNTPPNAPAPAKTIMAHQSRRPHGRLLLPAAKNAPMTSRPERRSACCIAVAKGCPFTSRSLKSSLGERIKPGLNGTKTHQLYESSPRIPKTHATTRRMSSRSDAVTEQTGAGAPRVESTVFDSSERAGQ